MSGLLNLVARTGARLRALHTELVANQGEVSSRWRDRVRLAVGKAAAERVAKRLDGEPLSQDEFVQLCTGQQATQEEGGKQAEDEQAGMHNEGFEGNLEEGSSDAAATEQASAGATNGVCQEAEVLRQLVLTSSNADELALFHKFATSGVVLCIKLRIDAAEQGAGHAKPLISNAILGFARGLLQAGSVWGKQVRLVKEQSGVYFALCSDAGAAFRAACRAKAFIDGMEELPISCGGISMAQGETLLLPNDLYGDPVNVASKLAEDTAIDGQILATKACFDAAAVTLSASEAKTVSVSGVALEYVVLEPKVFFEVAPWPSLEAVIAVVGEKGKGRRRVQAVAEALAEVREIRKEIEANKTCAATLGHPHEYMEGVCTMCAGPEKQEEDEEEVPRVTDLVDVEAIRKEQLQDVAVIATDLSGFTRLTKKYGTMHYLRIILRCREVWRQELARVDGQITRFIGDNVEAWVGSAAEACEVANAVWARLQAYNASREKDFQIRMGTCIAFGPTVVYGDNMVGEAHHQAHLIAEDDAEAGQIIVTAAVREQLHDGSAFGFHEMEKNIQVEGHAVECYTLNEEKNATL